MKAEIIAVGTELLLGDVINSNAAWISKELALIGVDVHHHTTVGDNPKRIHDVVTQALERAELLIFTGGLGPTEDDLTIASLADYFNTPMVSDPESLETIKAIFKRRNLPMVPSNLKQALRPEDAQVLPNPLGTAPGIIWDISKKAGKTALILSFPGVPKELYAMWPQAKIAIQKAIKAAGEAPAVLSTCFLNFFGLGESALADKLKDLMRLERPTVAPYVGKGGIVRIRVAAKAASKVEAEEIIKPIRDQIIIRCSHWYIGEGDIATEGLVADLLKQKGLTVGVAESCTGGLVSSRLTDVDGSSAYTSLNVVTYSNAQKAKILGVSQSVIDTNGAVSEPVARQMANGIKRLSGCDIGLSLTGIAGPTGGSDEKPVGLVFIGICGINGETAAYQVMVNPSHSREDIKYLFSQYALDYLRQYAQQL